jgi:hypothetical protein
MPDGTVVNAIGQRIAVDEARAASVRVDALDKHCWRNSIRTLRIVYRRDPTARYVEGHAISKFGLVCEHGWVEVGEGDAARIIDPTPSWQADGDNPPVYYGAKRYTAAQVPKAQKAWTCPVPLVAEGRAWTDLRDDDYRASYVTAWSANMGCSAEAAEAFLFKGDMALFSAERKAS